MESLIGIAAILIGLIFVGFGAYRIITTAETVKRLKIETEALYNQSHAALVQLESQAEALSKRVDERKSDLKDLRERHKEVNSALSLQTREKRPAIWIASNRRNKGDTEYRANIFCSRLGGDWNKGREYVLWAPDDEQARRGFDAKFPPSSGYEIEDVRRARDTL